MDSGELRLWEKQRSLNLVIDMSLQEVAVKIVQLNTALTILQERIKLLEEELYE